MFPAVAQRPVPSPSPYDPQADYFYNHQPSLPVAPQYLQLPRHGAQSGDGHGVHRSSQQFAYPLVRRNSTPALSHPSSTQTVSEKSEHMLRRKTPNGTLSAGYDGSPVEWTMRPHANKHILLPSSRNVNQQRAGSNGSLAYEQTDPWVQPGLTTRFSSDAASGMGQHVVPSAAASHIFVGEGMGTGWAFSPHGPRPPVMDSMLNQVPMQQSSNAFWLNGQVPTVLQPMYQPSLGPTASNGQGPFGPYWPDGAFIPYRPAARRDVRYSGPHGIQGLIGLSDASRGSPQSQGWAPFPDQPSMANHSQRMHGYVNGSTQTNHPLDQAGPGWSHHPPLIQTNNVQGHASHYGHLDSSQDYSNHVENSHLSHHHNLHHGHPPQPPLRMVHTDRSSKASSDFNLQSGNGQFKDKVLAWAHRVYVDLLASVHQSRKNVHSNRAGSTQQSPPRPGIWPRPPKQPYAGRTDEAHFQPDAKRRASSDGEAWQSHPEIRLKKSSRRDMDNVDHFRDHGYASSQRAFSNAPQYIDRDVPTNGSWESHKPRQTQGPAGILSSPNNQTTWSGFDHGMRNNGGPDISPIYANTSHLNSNPATNAMAALEMVTKLCSESSWKWVDGMLLGGCLAYGLGDYTKALRWYSKILEIDANHVEAISNLAATLLSLNRRDEAEQYWLRSVKLRPSYFEAVEHLIGLLCGDHRGSEAVAIIEFVERSLKHSNPGQTFTSQNHHHDDDDSETSRSSSVATTESSETITFDFDCEGSGSKRRGSYESPTTSQSGFGSSGYGISGSENGRILALVHAKGNMLYALGDNRGAAQAFEDAVLIGAGRRPNGIQGLIKRILAVMSNDGGGFTAGTKVDRRQQESEPVLLPPDKALQTARLVFPHNGDLPGLRYVANGMAKKAAISTTSNSLLSLAKIFQDGMSSGANGGPKATSGVRDILALYYLSLALQPSPSTANNVGILLASVQQPATSRSAQNSGGSQIPYIPGVVPGSGVALALAYYNYGLNLDAKHAHLYTNVGSLLKDIGQLGAAIKMYEQAVSCDGNFDIALANLANAVKDRGKISEAIVYYRRAVNASPEFAEAVCGLANALNSVCAWAGRGGVVFEDGKRDRWHVNEKGMLVDARVPGGAGTGWIKRVVDIVEKQLREGEQWGKGVLRGDGNEKLLQQLEVADSGSRWSLEKRERIMTALKSWAGHSWEGPRVVRMIERAAKRLGWHWYRDIYLRKKDCRSSVYARPQLPVGLSVPAAPTVLPFHTFTCPLTAKQIRMISQRNGLRISCSTLGSPWLRSSIYKPPAPPRPQLNVGYVSSDFNNHPLAHLMQSVFGFHDSSRVKAFCYATTASDGLDHRKQIEREAPVFHDTSTWSADRLVQQIVQDGIHILINLNGYTRGARNEVFAARPAPIQMSFMGFAGTLGAEWCDYILADETAIPTSTLRPWRRNVDIEDVTRDESYDGNQEDWVYSENIIFARDTFFCCDHRQSAPDSQGERLSWEDEQSRRWDMRKRLFPTLTDDAIILGNFNQLYKIDPSTFRSWLRILARVPKAILWLLRFPDVGEENLKQTAQQWAGHAVADRIIFTDVAPKHLHISRARVCDLFLDTPECNAHTTAADVLWSGTPLLTLQRYDYKMCSRMAASILKGALPKNDEGAAAEQDLIATSEEDYEEKAQRLANGFFYPTGTNQVSRGQGRLFELRKLLYESRWTSALFDTRRWVRDLEEAYEVAWRKWVAGEGGDIWL
ncbi:MAG: hypothetical protein M4579_000818 [Chaenotheca gracillima]|nr:MAG: hypothetical protein M4579_000818 [Chaenotheca gracillima]